MTTDRQTAITPRRIFLAAFGDPGHAFPMLALGEQLVARGHSVCLESWQKWRDYALCGGMTFVAAPEYPVFPTQSEPLKPFEATVKATRVTRPAIAAFKPDVVIHDVLTQAPALAAELEGIATVTLIPHLYPWTEPEHPLYSIGARIPRCGLGRSFWRKTAPLTAIGLRRGRDEYNAARQQVGLEPKLQLFPGLSRKLTLVATLPELEYRRSWPDWVRIVGPLLWEPPGEPVRPPPGPGNVVLVAPSTSQDRDHKLLRRSLAALASSKLRVIATYNGDVAPENLVVPPNAVVVPWLSYKKTMPACNLVICHGGHGTLARALASNCPVIVSPAAGDMAENGARIQWAGLGQMILPRLLGPRSLRVVVADTLADDAIRRRVGALARNFETSSQQASEQIERFLSRS